MTLSDLRKKVIFQNSVDVWIAACREKNADWDDQDGYKDFIKYLNCKNLSLKKYSLCVSDGESMDEFERRKARFAKTLSDGGDPNGATYSIRLSDSAVGIIRSYSF